MALKSLPYATHVGHQRVPTNLGMCGLGRTELELIGGVPSGTLSAKNIAEK